MSARLEVIAGPMFSGKTELLIHQLHRIGYARKRALILKPARDTRTEGLIASRRMTSETTTVITDKLHATPVRDEAHFQELTAGEAYDVLAVDEAQFFPLDEPMKDSLGWFGRAIRSLLARRRDSALRIIIAGLDLDGYEWPFGPMPGLLALADKVDKVTAICMECGADDAHLTYRLIGREGGLIAIGDAKEYKALCRKCFPAW